MKPFPLRRPRLARAFTLVELLLVLVILAVLAGIVLTKFTGRTQQSRQTAAQSQLTIFETALDAFEIDNGRYPTSQEGLNALMEAPPDLPNWKKLIAKIPQDPWGNPYVYRSPGQHNTDGYDLYSFGPNGQEGDADDISNWTR